jgi:hypothetical protein
VRARRIIESGDSGPFALLIRGTAATHQLVGPRSECARQLQKVCSLSVCVCIYRPQYSFYPLFASLFIEKCAERGRGPLLNINKIVSGLYEKIKKLIMEKRSSRRLCVLLAAVCIYKNTPRSSHRAHRARDIKIYLRS